MSTPESFPPVPPFPPAEDAGPPPAPPSLSRESQAQFREDIRTPWGWRELVLFAVFAFVGLMILTNLMAVAAMAWLGVKLNEIQKFATTNAVFISVRQLAWSAALILYLFLAIRVRRSAPFWRTIGWRRLRLQGISPGTAYLICVFGGVALAVGIEFASTLFRAKSALPIEALFHDRRGVLWLMADGILVAPLVEETIFRGYLYPVMARSFGIAGGVMVTGVLFGLMHAPQLWGGWGQIGLLAVVGIVLSYARARSGTVLTSYLLHLSYNSFLFFGFYVYTSGLRHFPPSP